MKLPKDPLLATIHYIAISRYGNPLGVIEPRGKWAHPTKAGPGRRSGRKDGATKRMRRSKIHRACMAGRANDHVA